jgi:hypothetical protein
VYKGRGEQGGTSFTTVGQKAEERPLKEEAAGDRCAQGEREEGLGVRE